MSDTERLIRRHQKFEGFGEKHTGAKWAKLLGIPRNTLWRYLFQRGLTIEEVAELRGIEYHPQKSE